MVLPVTARILILRDIKVLHLELTDVCQAACTLCAVTVVDKKYETS
jgi:hypothetical protein